MIIYLGMDRLSKKLANGFKIDLIFTFLLIAKPIHTAT